MPTQQVDTYLIPGASPATLSLASQLLAVYQHSLSLTSKHELYFLLGTHIEVVFQLRKISAVFREMLSSQQGLVFFTRTLSSDLLAHPGYKNDVLSMTSFCNPYKITL